MWSNYLQSIKLISMNHAFILIHNINSNLGNIKWKNVSLNMPLHGIPIALPNSVHACAWINWQFVIIVIMSISFRNASNNVESLMKTYPFLRKFTKCIFPSISARVFKRWKNILQSIVMLSHCYISINFAISP